MHTRRPGIIAGSAAAALLLFVGCLPGDTRPTPAVVHFTVEPGPAMTSGVTTSDGWQITFEKLLAGLGDAAISGSSCVVYANARYDRLFDFTVPGQQRISDVYGVGTCAVQLSIRYLDRDAPLGEGVTAADLALMHDEDAAPGAVRHWKSVYVRGSASRGATTKRFDWLFSAPFNLLWCVGVADAARSSQLVLEVGAAREFPLVIHGEELFRERRDEASPLVFDAMADADADGDQAISLEELASVPGPAPEADAGVMDPDSGIPTLEDALTRRLPRLIRLGDGEPCIVEVP